MQTLEDKVNTIEDCITNCEAVLLDGRARIPVSVDNGVLTYFWRSNHHRLHLNDPYLVVDYFEEQNDNSKSSKKR